MDPLGITPPALIRPAEDYTEEAILKAMKTLRRGMVLDRRAYGVWLNRLKAKVGYGRWEEACQRVGLSVRRANRWIELAQQATPLPDDLAGLEKADAEYATWDKMSQVDEEPNPQPVADQQPINSTPQSTPTETPRGTEQLYCRDCRTRGLKEGCKACIEFRREKASLFAPNEEAPPSGGGTAPAPGQSGTKPSPNGGEKSPEGLPGAGSVGDACEQLPPGAIVDPEGHILPPGVADALAGAPGAEKARELLREAVKEIRAFAETPAGVYVDAKHITTRIAAAVRQMNCHILKEGNTFRCDGATGHGCPGNGSCSKCRGRLYIPKPLVGDQGPKPKKPYGGPRRG